MLARAMVTEPSSSGWRSNSSTFRGNSGNSSRNSTPWCARLTSPGWGSPGRRRSDRRPRPCGAARGTDARTAVPFPGAAVPRHCAPWWFRAPPRSVSGGRTPASRLASMVLPEPGGPIISTLCTPAAATSSARFAVSPARARRRNPAPAPRLARASPPPARPR